MIKPCYSNFRIVTFSLRCLKIYEFYSNAIHGILQEYCPEDFLIVESAMEGLIDDIGAGSLPDASSTVK